MKIDVVLVNPGSRAGQYQALGEDYSAIEPPSLSALFATYLRQHGLSVAMIDAPALGYTPEQVADLVTDSFDPVLVVLVVYGFQPSGSTQNMVSAGQTCRAIKERRPDFKIMATGTHVSALPERTMLEEEVDFVCTREGPQTIRQVVQALKEKWATFHPIPSLAYRQGAAILVNQPGDLLADLDTVMPGGAWDLLPMDLYRAHNWHSFEHIEQRQPYASIHTSLGCPYRCTFCCINAPFGKSTYRMWSPATVGREIDHLATRYGVQNLKFVDEMFVLNQAHVLGVCEEITDRKLGDWLNIWAYARVDTVKDEYLDKLRAAGFRWLALGIESGSKHVRDGSEKGRFGNEDIIKTVRKVQAAGINVIGNYIFGLPDDTLETMRATLDLALEAQCEFANFYSAMAYPGSKLYTLAVEKGLRLPEKWSGYSQHSHDCTPLPTDTLTGAQVLEFRDRAFHDYFNDGSYLQMIERKFGRAVVDHLGRMVAIPLPRKLLGDEPNG